MGRVDAVGASPRALASETFPVWGGDATVVVADPSGLDAAVSRLKRTVELFDAACSSFGEDSELVFLNASAGEPVVVSSLLLTAVRTALRAARVTDGAVDPTVGQALIAHGFTPWLTAGVTPRVARVPGYAAVKLDPVASSVELPRGVALDLGATAKALAADMAARGALSTAGSGVLVSLCGDVATAGAPPAGGWRLRVVDDHRHDEGPGQTVTIGEGGLATSSVTVRRAGPDAAHHLIDPATGMPAAGPWRTASVVAGSCVDANTASTAAIVLGERGPAWLEDQWLPARLVAGDSSVRHVCGWPAEGDEL
jgi:thiamine biosynthesis lipoprotein